MKKIIPLCIGLALASHLAAAQSAPRTNDTETKITLTAYPETAYQLAADYLRTKPKIETDSAEELLKAEPFAAFVEKQGLKRTGRMAGAVAKLVVLAVSVAEQEEIEPDLAKPAFQLLVRESLGRALNTTIAASAPQPKEGGKPAAEGGSGEARNTPATPRKDPKDEPVEPKANFKNIQAYFHTGVTLLNPYKIDSTSTPPADGSAGNSLAIAPSSQTDVHAYLEFVYNNRWAWNQARIDSQFSECGKKCVGGCEGKNKKGCGENTGMAAAKRFVKFSGLQEGDIQARVGYTFSSEDTPTANTLTGSGDFNAEISASWPFLISRAPTEESAFSVGLEAGYGVVTEKSALRAHQNVFLGLAYTTSFKDPFGSKDAEQLPRRVLLHFRLGRSWVDSVRYLSDGSNEIHSINDGLPRYFREETVGFEAQLLYPVKNSTFISFAGKAYPQLKPGLWSMQIGVTTSFADLLDGFFK